jgi:translocating chain-associated membrane protein 1
MTFSLKFFMLQQMAFWLHCYPELLLMKQYKTDRVYTKIVLYTSSLLIILGAYVIKLQRLAIILLTLHYLVETLFHFSRLVKYHGRDNLALKGYKLWKIFFLSVRILTVIISVLTLWFGLGKEARMDDAVTQDTEETLEAWPKQFNTPFFRVLCLLFVLGIQGWITWTFLLSQRRLSHGKKGDKSED